MEFESIAGHDLGAPVRDVVQEAVDTTATRYARSPDVDVTRALVDELSSRGVRARDDATLQQVAAAIRSGHPVELGAHDDSVG